MGEKVKSISFLNFLSRELNDPSCMCICMCEKERIQGSQQPLQKQLKHAESIMQQQTENKQDTTDIQASIIKIKESLDFIHHHKATAQQRETFKTQRNNLQSDECIVVFDFKENITIGDGPLETNRDFYNKSQRSVFGLTVYYKVTNKLQNKVNNKTISVLHTQNQYIHFISEVLAHNGLFVCDCLTKIHKLEWMRRFKTIQYWSDCGPHFRSYEVLNHTLFEIPKKFKVTTFHHFWGEKHGKSKCDSEFSVLSQWLDELTNQKKDFHHLRITRFSSNKRSSQSN